MQTIMTFGNKPNLYGNYLTGRKRICELVNSIDKHKNDIAEEKKEVRKIEGRLQRAGTVIDKDLPQVVRKHLRRFFSRMLPYSAFMIRADYNPDAKGIAIQVLIADVSTKNVSEELAKRYQRDMELDIQYLALLGSWSKGSKGYKPIENEEGKFLFNNADGSYCIMGTIDYPDNPNHDYAARKFTKNRIKKPVK